MSFESYMMFNAVAFCMMLIITTFYFTDFHRCAFVPVVLSVWAERHESAPGCLLPTLSIIDLFLIIVNSLYFPYSILFIITKTPGLSE